MRYPTRVRLFRSRSLSGLLAAASIFVAGLGQAAERQVLAVAAVDSYADLKKQIGWFGRQIDNPGLAAEAVSAHRLAGFFLFEGHGDIGVGAVVNRTAVVVAIVAIFRL